MNFLERNSLGLLAFRSLAMQIRISRYFIFPARCNCRLGLFLLDSLALHSSSRVIIITAVGDEFVEEVPSATEPGY